MQLIGIEIGEWIKFLGVGPRRDLFYLPPIVLGLALALLAATWPNNRPQTWVARGLAVAVALLAFPAIAAIQLEPSSEWLFRLMLISVVVFVAAIGAAVAARAPGSLWPWLMMAIVTALGALLPTLQYLAVRPLVEEIMRRPIGIGLGVWLNAAGCLLAATMVLVEFAARVEEKKRQPPAERLPSDELGLNE